MSPNRNAEPIPTHLIEPDQPPRQSAGHAPLRRPNSVRRTTSIDVHWPGKKVSANMHFDCRGRDVYTGDPAAPALVLAEDHMLAQLSRDRTIENIEVTPEREYVRHLVGARGGGHLRKALNEVLPDRSEADAPLYLLIDDLSGASLVAMWSLSLWIPFEKMVDRPSAPKMEGVCIGFRPGASSLTEDGSPKGSRNLTAVVPLPNPEDPTGWHALPEFDGAHFRRARRIEVWHADDLIQIEAGFQDSGSRPEGGRVAVHEYTLRATADPDTQTLISVEAIAGTLPYTSCPAAPGNIHRLIGTPMSDLRQAVVEHLAGTEGCTHLNDALRALAEVPALFAALQAKKAARPSSR